MSALGGVGARVLLIGSGRHGDTPDALPPVPAAGPTVRALRDVLVDRCAVPPEHVRELIDPATVHEVATAVVDTAAGAGTTLVVYYVGHGLVGPAGGLHLAVRNTPMVLSAGLAQLQAYPITQLWQALGRSRASSVVVVLDCCFSGREPMPVARDASVFPRPSVDGVYLLAAARDYTAADATTGAGPAGLTAFSGELITLLRDGDPGLGPEITLDDAYRWLAAEFRRRAEAAPHAAVPEPRRQVAGGVDRLVLAANPAWRGAHEPGREPPAPGRSPYAGLRPFGEDDAAHFAGRDDSTAELLGAVAARTRDPGLLLVVGASGSGKSSLLRAGLLAGLRRSGLPGLPVAAGWPRAVLNPGEHPLHALAAAVTGAAVTGAAATAAGATGRTGADVADRLLADPATVTALTAPLPAGERLLLVVDQLEELFTLCRDPAARAAFVAALAALARGGSTVVVAALRADFYADATAYPELAAALARRQVLVRPMTGAQLRAAVERPAAGAGLALDGELTQLVLHDLGAADTRAGPAPGALPLLSHALWETWQRREGTRLTVRGYLATGGIRGAIAKTANDTYRALDEPARAAVRTMVLRLVRVGDDTADTARPAERAHLVRGLDPGPAAAALRALERARLVTVDDEVVRLSHEALITEWAQLGGWLAEQRDTLLVRQRLAEAAALWDASGRDDGDLYRGARLAVAVEHTDDGDLTDRERSFLRAGHRAQQRGARRLRAVVAGLAILLIVAVAAGVVAVVARGAADEQRLAAESRQLAAEALLNADDDPVGARRTALRAWRTSPTAEARGALLSAQMLSFPRAIATGMEGARVVDITPDGGLVAIGGGPIESEKSTRVEVWDVREHRLVASLPDVETVLVNVEFSPDGTLLATSSFDSVGSGAATRPAGVRIWEVPSGRLLTTVPAFGFTAWRPDGLAVAAMALAGGGLEFAEWDPRTGGRLRTVATGHVGMTEVAYSPDGSRLATGDGAGVLEVWDTATASLVTRRTDHADAATPGAEQNIVRLTFSDTLLATSASADPTMRFYDATTGEPSEGIDFDASHDGGPNALTFTAGGRTLLTADGVEVRTWETSSRHSTTRYTGIPVGGAPLMDIAQSADGRTEVAIDLAGTIRLWRMTGHWYVRFTGTGTDVAFSPDGDQLSAVDTSGDLHTWRADTAAPVGEPMRLGPSAADAVRYTPAGARVVATADARFVFLPADGSAPTETVFDGQVFDDAIAVSPDGRWIAAVHQTPAVRPSEYSATVRVWRADTFAAHTAIDLGAVTVGDITFAPDGRLAVLTNGDTGRLHLWDVVEPAELVVQPTGDDLLTTARFTPDGGALLTSGASRRIEVRDPVTGELRTSFGDHASTVRSIAVSPDGAVLASATIDSRVVQLWDLRAMTSLARLTGHDDVISGLAWAPDGRTLASNGAAAGEVAVWSVDPETAIADICRDLADTGATDLADLGCP